LAAAGAFRAILALFASAAVLGPHAAARAQPSAMEYAVKAAYLSKFAPFVEWPPAAFASATSPFQLCVLGQDPFGASLDTAVRGQRVDSHPIQIRRLQRVDAAAGCHILYLGESRTQTSADAARAVRGSPVLTVSDDGEAGGAIIRFVVKDNRVRFDIDALAAAANHVTISSKLLSLALTVRGGG
jgi:hypothetical protein